MVPDYDESKPMSYIVYLDMVNLYSYFMSLPLLVGDNKLLEREEIDKFDMLSVNPQGEIRYFLEIDLEYPSPLHHSHSDFPMAPLHLTITKDMLSPGSIRLGEPLGQKFNICKKLTPTLLNKERCLSFKQSPVLQSTWYDCDENTSNSFIHSGTLSQDLNKLQLFQKTTSKE